MAEKVSDGTLLDLVEDRPGGKGRRMSFGAAENRGAIARGVGGQGRGERGGCQEAASRWVHEFPLSYCVPYQLIPNTSLLGGN